MDGVTLGPPNARNTEKPIARQALGPQVVAGETAVSKTTCANDKSPLSAVQGAFSRTVPWGGVGGEHAPQRA